MTVPPASSEACRIALAKVLKIAQAADAARDTDSALAALGGLWFALQDAETTLKFARAEARMAAWEATLGVPA